MTKKFSEFLISPRSSLREAMSQLDKTHKKVLFVVDDTNHLIGSLSDGDIRRALLANADLNLKVGDFCNIHPHKLDIDYETAMVKNLFVEHNISALPVVNSGNLVSEIIFWEDLFEVKQQNIKKGNLQIPVLIMAGGQGTRLEPFTKILPKPLIPIGEKSIIELVIDKFLHYGIDEFYITVNHKAKIIKSFFEELDPPYKVNFIEENEPLGTIGALTLIKNKIDKPILVTNCDIVIDCDYSEFLKFHTVNNYGMSLIASLINHRIPYGICEIENGGNLKTFSEKPEQSFLASTGMYLINLEVVNMIPKNTFYHVTQLIAKLKDKGGKIGVFPISENSWVDTGEWAEYKKTTAFFNDLLHHF
ncbi:MAG: CBS domain-containing protein [Ignavibacteriales bacterium]|nr:CBS domain-containing protein [Melioribacteraceae bacterium]MCF8315145.1 CBS domain-containing protein [Ignavibacteriales bacterium]MCF8435859.1 CBS domain-containing protein [Ignavibacteriales bacterium]